MSDEKQEERPSNEAPASLPLVAGSDSSEADDWTDWEDSEDRSCHYCGGEGVMWGDELDDPLWYDQDKLYRCPCCNGSGDSKDCTFW